MKLSAIILIAITMLSTFTAHAGEIDSVAIVNAHNKLRAEVGVAEKLSYSPALAAAQAWVDDLKQTNHCQMRHSNPNGQYGENLFWEGILSWPDGRKELLKVISEQVVALWDKEKANYDYPAINAHKEKCAAITHRSSGVPPLPLAVAWQYVKTPRNRFGHANTYLLETG